MERQILYTRGTDAETKKGLKPVYLMRGRRASKDDPKTEYMANQYGHVIEGKKKVTRLCAFVDVVGV
jgi:hypothetical protein